MFSEMCEHSNGCKPEDGLPDLAMLSDISHQAINVNLRTRYQRDQIYTFSGLILIAVNPYKQLDIFGPSSIANYRGKKLDHTNPHIFALAEAMYTNLTTEPTIPNESRQTYTQPDKHPNQHHQKQQHSKSIKNQACVISGESGAGKTETTKLILSYLCAVTPNKSTWMEHQILEANTILEAFGNAKTVRNDNSSRFGKFIQVCFNEKHQINGCIIQDYLLEQSRITCQSIDERNYHVFYQLLSAGQTNEEIRKKFHLMPANFYDYLNKTPCYTIDGVDDCAMFDSLRMAMSVLNVEEERCDGLFSVLSAILWLGNLQFKSCDEDGSGHLSKTDQCHLTENDIEIIKIIAQLIGVKRENLELIMLRRQINVRGTVTEIPFNVHEAEDNRNGMAKALYSRLFSWIVNFINSSTNPDSDSTCFLGVLDIFGFENFDTNSFEQLCINYANEKLHKFFNHHMFAMEQELYQREGIEFCDINYTDNTPCLELLERPPSCILRLLSEECRIPKGSDSTFIEKLHSEFSSFAAHPFYIKGNDRRNWSAEFSVQHFAGAVTYSVKGFLQKNMDAQQNQLLDIIGMSDNPLLRDLANSNNIRQNSETHNDRQAPRSMNLRQESADSAILMNITSELTTRELRNKFMSQKSFCYGSSNGPTSQCPVQIGKNSTSSASKGSQVKGFVSQSSIHPSKTRPTVADAFRHQLGCLVELLNSVHPWYVRCIKPNLEKSATDYNDQQVLLQLKYLGMCDLIRIRREGYPIHFTKHQFVCRYRCLMLKYLRSNPDASPIRLNEENLDNYCVRMMKHFELNPADWKIGKTMVLLRANVHQPIEERRSLLFVEMAILIQSSWRSYVKQKQFKCMRASALRIQETFRAFRGRLLYLRKKRAVLTIQAYVRGMFAREIANALREIKRAEQVKERKLTEEKNKMAEEMLRREEAERIESKKNDEQDSLSTLVSNCKSRDIMITDLSTSDDLRLENSINERERNRQDHQIGSSSPMSQSNNSPDVSSISWVGQDLHHDDNQKKVINAHDKKEMEELVKVLERHGISLDSADQNHNTSFADFEKLYDVLGSQIQIRPDNQSVSPSVNEDDRCSMATIGTNCDGDSVSCSGQSQFSSTATDELKFNEEKRMDISDEAKVVTQSTRDETVKHNPESTIPMFAHNNLHSNSTESIESIVSSTSANSNQILTSQQLQSQNESQDSVGSDIHMKQVLENQNRTSTFTGNSLIVTGSKLASNGRPLTRIEEEPVSAVSSPSKIPNENTSELSNRAQSLFPPSDDVDSNLDQSRYGSCYENKKKRLERKIVQVQQELQLQRTINSTKNCPPIRDTSSNDETIGTNQNASGNIQERANVEENIYHVHKTNIVEYAEQTFNCHPRDSIASGGVIRTLTRRRKSVDTLATEFLTKGEMLSYNPTFVIPISHIKMHDPHNSQISCSMFKNLCKYMTGESVKSDSEIRIIQSIIRHGIEKSELRDEIYVQIIRQLTNNQNHEYCLRLWILLGLVSASFSASKSFSRHLVAYLRNKPRKDPSITCHAQFCLENLQAPKMHPRRYPPSPLEIQACKSLMNLTCKIYLLDGRFEMISVHPCDTVFDILTKLGQKIELQSIDGWALYESYIPGSSKYPHPLFEQRGDFERSLRLHSYMADILALWQDEIPRRLGTSISLKLAQKRLEEGNFRLTLKKKIFRGPKIRNDPVEISLLYSQAVHNVTKKDNFLVDENLALSLAGLQAQIMYGNFSNIMTRNHSKSKSPKVNKGLSKHGYHPYDIDNFICQRLRLQATSRSKKEWASLISQSHRQYHNSHEVYCKMRYLSMVIYHCPLYGTATFKVTYKGYQTIDQNLLLGVNSEGLVLIRSSDRALISAYRYNDICEETGISVFADESIIQLNVRDRTDMIMKCLSFESNEEEEIATLMVSYCPSLNVNRRGGSISANYTLDPSFEINARKKCKLKMTLEDRMRTHQEVQNARRAIAKSGKLRKPNSEELSTGLIRHTLRRLSSNRTKNDKLNRFENIYGIAAKSSSKKNVGDIPQASSDYNIYSGHYQGTEDSINQSPTDVAGATASTIDDEITRTFPHRYWVYTRTQLKNSLLIIYDPDLEEAALSNFNSILLYSGLVSSPGSNESYYFSSLDSSSIDSGIASQQSLANLNGKLSGGSPSSASSSDIYDVCPKKLDERELLRLAQGILDRCLKKDADILKNEFFLQLIKQTTDHPEPNCEINQRHWQLLALACSVTFPSDPKILSYLYAHLRRCSLDQVTDEGQFAQFALRSLQGTLDTKGRRYAPSETEILSTINCRRIYARVYFLDGQFQAVEFDPCATIAEVVDQIKQKIGLKPESSGYALFQPLDDECEQVLQPDEKVGDAIAAWETWHRVRQAKLDMHVPQNAQVNFSRLPNKSSLASLNTGSKCKSHRFIFKKYLFLDSSTDFNDPVDRELIYYQTVASIKEDKFPVLEQEATILCALKAQIEIGDYTKLSNLPREHIRTVYKQVIMSLMPPHAFNNLPIPAIAQQHQAFRELSCVDTKKYFFNLIQSIGRANLPNNPRNILLHRAHIYEAKQTFATAWPSDIWIIITQMGLHMLVAKSRRVLASWEYRQIVEFSSNNNYLMIITLLGANNRMKHTFHSKQAQQIAQQMKDYKVICSSDGSKRRKSVEFNLKQQTHKNIGSNMVPETVQLHQTG